MGFGPGANGKVGHIRFINLTILPSADAHVLRAGEELLPFLRLPMASLNYFYLWLAGINAVNWPPALFW